MTRAVIAIRRMATSIAERFGSGKASVTSVSQGGARNDTH
jgi:hypothetical protein